MKHVFKEIGQRLLATVLVLCLLLGLPVLPGHATSADGTSSSLSQTAGEKSITVIAGSDFQYSNSDHGIAGGHVTNILGAIKKDGYTDIDGFIFAGDYSQAFTVDGTMGGLTHLKGLIADEFPQLSDDRKFWLQGNHDPDVLTTDGSLSPSGARDTAEYGVFMLNEKDYNWYNDNEATIKASAASLRSYLNAKCRAEYSKPIFIVSHMQLHYSMRTHDSGDGKYANYLFDVINEAGANGLNIIFLFGHNHSNGWDDYLGGAATYLSRGDSILIAQRSTTEFETKKLNFTYLNAGYVGYYSQVNTGAESDLTMTVYEITDENVTIKRYTADGVHDLKSMGVTNAHKNETAYSPDTRVYQSPQTLTLNKTIQSTAVTGIKVVGDGIRSVQATQGATQMPMGYRSYQTFEIAADGYVDGTPVTITLPTDESFDPLRPVLVIDHQRNRVTPVEIDAGTVTFQTNHLRLFSIAQADVTSVSAAGSLTPYFRTMAAGEYPVEGVPYVITDSNITNASHWVLTGNAVEKNVGSVLNTGLALDEVADPTSSPVWYYDGKHLRYGSTDGSYLNISYTGDYNGDSSTGLVTVGDYNATITGIVHRFGSGPSIYVGNNSSDTPLYLAHRNSGSNSIAAVYAKSNYNTSLWYLHEVISSINLSVTPSQDTVSIGNSILMGTQVTTGSQSATEYTINWTSEDKAVATVSSEGIVTPIAPGQTYITATLTAVNGQTLASPVTVELLITVLSHSKTNSAVTATAQFGQQKGIQEAPVAGQSYMIGFYAGGWMLKGNTLTKDQPGYNGLNDKEGLQVAPRCALSGDSWYFDGTYLYSGTQADPQKYMIFNGTSVTVGPAEGNNEPFIVDTATYEYWPYISVSAGRLNHYGGKPHNVAFLYSGNNFMCFYKVIDARNVTLSVSPSKSVLYPQEQIPLAASVLTNGNAASEYKIFWTSTDLSVATVDGNGLVTAVSGGHVVITATVVSVNGSATSEAISVEIPIQVVRTHTNDTGSTVAMTVDRTLEATTQLQPNVPYVITSYITHHWAFTGTTQTAPYNSQYSGLRLEHFENTGHDQVWYYEEATVDGTSKQYLRYGSVNGDYLQCHNRIARLGATNAAAFDAVTQREGTTGFMISYASTARNLHQLGGVPHNTAIPTTQYASSLGTLWVFNTILPEFEAQMTVEHFPEGVHPGQSNKLDYTISVDGAEVTDYTLEIISSDSNIITVEQGVFTAHNAGNATLTFIVQSVNNQTLQTPVKITVPVTVDAHSWTDATCTTSKTCSVCGAIEGEPSGHQYESTVIAPDCTNPGYTVYTCFCGDSYTADNIPALGHSYTTVTVPPSCTTDGSVTDTCRVCGDVQTEILSAPGHTYKTVVTAPTCTEDGYTTYTCSCGDSYKDDIVTAIGHDYTSEITTQPGCETAGIKTFTCTSCNDSYTEAVEATGHSYEAVTTAPTCAASGFTTYTCACGSSYVSNYVDALGHTEETVPGYAATCTETGLTDGTKCSVCGETLTAQETIPALGHTEETVPGYAATCTETGLTDGTKCSVCGETLTAQETIPALDHNFENGTCTNCGETDPDSVKPSVVPTIGLKYPSLSFEDVIIMNVYYTATNLQDVVEMGLITNLVKPEVVSLENADNVIPGYGVEGNFYFSSTAGIAPKDIGDNIYFAVYAKLADGTVTYTPMIGYSPKTYALNQLKTGAVEMRPLVAAMLNYGAAAQTYFNYKTDALVNATMTDEQKAMAEPYRADMIATVTQASGEKLGTFISDKTYSKRYPTISFEGAFCINYYFQPTLEVVGDVTMYIWSLEDYEAAEVLTKENATKAVKMELAENGEYLAAVDGIPAKDLDKAAYVSFIYNDGTTEHCGGVIAYTIGMYCKSQAAGTGSLAELAKACAVYGYYAKQLFNK